MSNSKFHNNGVKCGIKIAEIVKNMHSDIISVIPLYCSCIVITQNEIEKIDGTCIIHTYADPHWLGEEINIENLKRPEFHETFRVYGKIEGPEILKII